MQIDREEARRIAALARLDFDDAGLDRMAGEMTKILSYIDQLRDVDVAAAGEASGATPLRPDVVREAATDLERVATNAPSWRDGHFVVPQVIGGE